LTTNMKTTAHKLKVIIKVNTEENDIKTWLHTFLNPSRA